MDRKISKHKRERMKIKGNVLFTVRYKRKGVNTSMSISDVFSSSKTPGLARKYP